MMRTSAQKFSASLCFAVLLLGNSGCEEQNRNPETLFLALPSEEDAEHFVEKFLSAFQDEDLDAALQDLCEQDQRSLLNARKFMEQSQAIGSRFRFEDFKVRSALAHWVGREPYYWVDVSFTVEKRFILRAYRVRVRDGCIEHFLAPQDGNIENAGLANINAESEGSNANNFADGGVFENVPLSPRQEPSKKGDSN
ncbi:MAG: hypothetical protein GY822_03920 [Deltaproteobacteria bacterium]|nr:hypothetical protein [Deltaproteobacteria bacterium]